MGLIIPALSFSKDSYKVQMRKNQLRGDGRDEILYPCRGFYFDSSLYGFFRQLPTSRSPASCSLALLTFLLRKVLFSSLHSWL